MKDNLCCCVCLKEEPFENNPIISCDGKNCNTIVHKDCYGIQQIPDGAWFCQKCISQERSARVRCELCPSREGALKHTNKGVWCHIICALFTPGAEFLDPERLETISVDKIGTDKLNKICSICEKNNRLDRASVGTCIQCIKSGCKVLFHVTCAQSLGLLTETVSVKDGIRYVAYCAAHKHKTKHRDFTIRLSNSLLPLGRYEKHKSRQSPPHLEKSDEDCVTPHDVSSDLDKSAYDKNPNISSSSGNANFSTDSTSFSDSVDRFAPEIVTHSEGLDKNDLLKADDSAQRSIIKQLDHPPLIHSEPQQVSIATKPVPPNICCSDASESIAKEESSVKSAHFSTISNSTTSSEASFCRPAKRQATSSTSDIPSKKPKQAKLEPQQSASVETVQNSLPKIEKVKRAKKAGTKIKTESRAKKKPAVPFRPKSIFSQVSSIIGASSSVTNTSTTTSTPISTAKPSGSTCQSMEELLEWQWDQTGSLLMQQAEASDIASLLSCLHDLKNENEQLLAKQLKLVQRRDHLKAVNAKLQLQLVSRTQESTSQAVSSSASSSLSNTQDSRNISRSIPMTSVQSTIPKTAPKTKPMEQSNLPQFKQMHMTPNTVNGDVRNIPITATKPVYGQQTSLSSQGNSSWNATTIPRIDQSVNHPSYSFLKHYQQHPQQQHPQQQHQQQQHQQQQQQHQQQQQQHQQQQQQQQHIQMHQQPNSMLSQIGQSQPPSASVHTVLSQTDLVTFLNSQLHSQLASCSQSTNVSSNPKSQSQEIHMTPNTQANLELIYQAIQQKKQHQPQPQSQQFQIPQQQVPMHANPYYHQPNKIPNQSLGVFENPRTQSSDFSYMMQLCDEINPNQFM